MTTPLAFVDTETLGLDPERHAIWEVAIIRATHDVERHTLVTSKGQQWACTVALPDGALARADSYALKIGGFHDRYDRKFITGHEHYRRDTAANFIESYTRGRHLVGAVPSFDAIRLDALLREHDLCPMWHYHLIDVEALAAGYIARRAGDAPNPEAEQADLGLASPPWRSDDLAAALGVTVAEDLRHTAMGDADWALRTYAAVYDLAIKDES